MLKIRLKNEIVLPVKINEEDTATFTLRKQFKEDEDFSTMSKYVTENADEIDPSKRFVFKDGKYANYLFEKKRRMLVSCSDNVVDENGNKVVITDADGKVDEEVQKAVFQFLDSDEERTKIIDAFYSGEAGNS
jgi:hypothetical protein